VLFRTVYGPELQSIAEFIKIQGSVNKETIYRTFLPVLNEKSGPSDNLDDALSFLVAGRIIERQFNGKYISCFESRSFHDQLYRNLRSFQLSLSQTDNPNDRWFFEVLDQLFIKTDQSLHFGLHKKINALDIPEKLSEEKVNAWKRVAECVGLGYRVYSGFMCAIHPERLKEIVVSWSESEGPLQVFLEEHLNNYLPWNSHKGDISLSLKVSLHHLHSNRLISLGTKQDLPFRSYCGDQRFNWISKEALT